MRHGAFTPCRLPHPVDSPGAGKFAGVAGAGVGSRCRIIFVARVLPELGRIGCQRGKPKREKDRGIREAHAHGPSYAEQHNTRRACLRLSPAHPPVSPAAFAARITTGKAKPHLERKMPQLLLRHPRFSLLPRSFSPDGGWIAAIGERGGGLLIAPVPEDGIVGDSEWISISPRG